MSLEFISKAFNWGFRNDKMFVEIECPKEKKEAVQQFVTSLTDKEYDVTVKQHRERKSLDANAYSWVLLGELSKVIGRSDKDIYKDLIQNIGGNSYIVPVKDELIENWIHLWENEPKTKIGWTSKELGKCKNTPGYTNMINYYGSSMYDTAQMSRLIDLVVQECQEQNIDTRTPQQIEELKQKWEESKK